MNPMNLKTIREEFKLHDACTPFIGKFSGRVVNIQLPLYIRMFCKLGEDSASFFKLKRIEEGRDNFMKS